MRINTRSLRALGLLGLALVTANPALAGNVHLKGGKKAEPAFSDEGRALSARGGLVGLGKQDIVIRLTASGEVDASCFNPGNGEHRPPGQNPAEATIDGFQPIPKSEIKNGSVAFDLSTISLETIPGAPDCPSHRWSEVVHDISFTGATITVEQPAGTAVLTMSCSFSEPTSDGPVAKDDVTCTSS